MNNVRPSQLDLQATAKQVMLAHGFEPDFPPQVAQQLAELKTHPPQVAPGGNIRDLRNLLWSSIDNDTSRDLDQIEVAERLPNGKIKVLIGNRGRGCFRAKSILRSMNMRRKKQHLFTRVCGFSQCCRRSFRLARRRCSKTETS